MLRFAPSPTGDMHIGNLRAAIFNYIIAKQRKKEFLIRIEDTDTARNIQNSDKEILSILNLFGLLWDKLFYQSENFPRHRQIAQYLIQKDLAFYCYCTKDFLDKKREEFAAQKRAFRYDDSWAQLEKDTNSRPVVRLRAPKTKMEFHDEIKGDLSFEVGEIDSFVILKDDGIPTYNFACAVDDMLFDIDFIVRGEDHTSNTPKQILVHKYLNYDKQIGFAHLPIILDENGKKMSKRDKSGSVSGLLEQGFLPSAIINYLILMGNKTPKEVFKLDEAIEFFDIKNIAKAPVRFDLTKLRFLNREHLKMLTESEFALLLSSQDISVGGLAKLHLQEASTLNEIREKLDLIFAPKDIACEYERQIFKEQCEILLGVFEQLLDSENEQILGDYENLKSELMAKSGLKGKNFFKPLRILLTGNSHGLELNELYPFLRFHLREILKVK